MRYGAIWTLTTGNFGYVDNVVGLIHPKVIEMVMNTLLDTVRAPMGTARLLEGHSTLQRARDANLTCEQIRTVFPDVADCADEAILGFVEIGHRLITGDARFKGKAFTAPNSPASADPSPAF